MNVNWYYQDDNAPERNYTLTITIEDRISNVDWSFTTNHHLLVDIFSVDISSDDDDRVFVMNPGSEISFDVSIINNGNSFDIINIETDSSSSGWDIDIDGPDSIEINQISTFLFSLINGSIHYETY